MARSALGLVVTSSLFVIATGCSRPPSPEVVAAAPEIRRGASLNGATAGALPGAVQQSENASAVDAGPVDVLVELFTSEGCSSCPSAEKALAALRIEPPPGARIIPLELHVDYWDYIGHADRYARAEYTDRQRRYQAALGASSIYTPQAVVDGRAELVGSKKNLLASVISEASRRPHARLTLKPDAKTQRVAITIDALPTQHAAAHAHLFVADVETEVTTRPVRGENAGATLAHTWVATRVTDLGLAGEPGTRDVTREASVPFGPHRATVAWLASPDGVWGTAAASLE